MVVFIIMLLIISAIDIINLIKTKNKKVLVLYATLNTLVLILGIYYYINPTSKSLVSVLFKI